MAAPAQLREVPRAAALVEAALARRQRKVPSEARPGWKVTRVRAFYLQRLAFVASQLSAGAEAAARQFPRPDEVHPFYADLFNVLYDRERLLAAADEVEALRGAVEAVARDAKRAADLCETRDQCEGLYRDAVERMTVEVEGADASLVFLESVRQHMARLPALDPRERTLLLLGMPNTGRSAFFNRVAPDAAGDGTVQPFAFTTKSLRAGHLEEGGARYQAVDTPGLLDRPLEERNTIEMMTLTALAHLERRAALYFVDLSEECGYPAGEQLALLGSLAPLLAGRPALLVVSKADLRGLDPASRAAVEEAAAACGAGVVETSSVTGEGVAEAVTRACALLPA